MNDFPKRAGVSIAIFVLGLHRIGIGIAANGADDPRNPIWALLSWLFSLEVLVVKGALVLACIAALITLGLWIVDWTRPVPAVTTARTESQMKTPDPTQPVLVPVVTSSTPTIPRQATSNQPIKKPAPPAPSPEELKNKAIDQILRGF